MQWAKQKQSGFTIVELLIVVVVIAILAAITIVAYTGIRDRADASAMQSELTSTAKKLATAKVDSGTEQYPLNLSAAGVTNTSINYSSTIGSDRGDYCIDNTRGQQSFYISSRKPVPQAGSCTVSNGMVGWWRFNGNANDSSPSGNNGVVTNTTLTTGYNDTASSSYLFNGTNAYVTANTPVIERISFTLTIWFKTSLTADRKLVSTTGGGAHIIQVMSPNGVLRTCVNACYLGTRSVSDNKWHFVSVVGTTTGTNVYLDGEQTPEVTSPYTGAVTMGSQIRIGADYTPSFYFNGQIDDVRLYNRSLSIDETQVLYSAGAQ